MKSHLAILATLGSLLLVSETVVAASVEPEVGPVQVARSLIKPLVAKEDKALAMYVRTQMGVYELDAPVKKALFGLLENDDFRHFSEQKQFAWDRSSVAQKMQFVYGYLQTQTNLTPESVAWYGLTMDLDAPWQTAIGSYQQLVKKRPSDFLPKLIMLARPIKTTAEADQWLALLKEAYVAAQTPPERAVCLQPIARRALELDDLNGRKHLTAITNWLGELEKSETVERLPIAKELNRFKFFVAFAHKDFAQAAEFADAAPLRPLRPVLFALTGNPEESHKALEALKEDTTLDRQKFSLDEIESITERLLRTARQ